MNSFEEVKRRIKLVVGEDVSYDTFLIICNYQKENDAKICDSLCEFGKPMGTARDAARKIREGDL